MYRPDKMEYFLDAPSFTSFSMDKSHKKTESNYPMQW